jgi:asparagine synthase (glutamine-hydrolysing)
MCGIWGIFGTDCEVYEYISCFFEIKHRGLDCFRFENMKRYENIGLGFHRLAFHDPVSGMQPMKLLSVPHIIMIYNGEIYNFREVKYILFIWNSFLADISVI